MSVDQLHGHSVAYRPFVIARESSPTTRTDTPPNTLQHITSFVYQRRDQTTPHVMEITRRHDTSFAQSGDVVLDVWKGNELEAQIRGWEEESGFRERAIGNARRMEHGLSLYPGLVEQAILTLLTSDAYTHYLFDVDSNHLAQRMHQRLSQHSRMKSIRSHGLVGKVIGVVKKER